MTSYNPPPKNTAIELIHHYGHLVSKWKWTILFVLILAVSATGLYLFLATPIYTAEGSIWIDDEPRILPFDQNSVDEGNNTQSHVYLLQSRALVLETIQKLKLSDNPDFLGRRALQKRAPQGSPQEIDERLIKTVMDRTAVTPIAGTRLVSVRFSHPNPKMAAEVLNALFSGYVDMIYRKRAAASEQATDVLRVPIAALRSEIEAREKQLNEFGLKNDIVSVGSKEVPALSRLTEFNTALTAATIDRINKLNIYRRLQIAPLGEFPDAPVGSLIETLRTQYLATTREYAAKQATLKAEHPEMIRLKSDLEAATTALQAETQNLVRNAAREYQAALQKEQALQKELDTIRKEAYDTNSQSLDYNNLRLELESKKTILESLTRRLNETDLSSGLKGMDAINVWIVNKATPPAKPTSPQKRKVALIGLLLGLAGGFGFAFGLEFLNQTVKTSRDVTLATGLPTLGSIPSFDSAPVTKGPAAEFRRLLTIFRGGGRLEEEKPKAARKRPGTGSTPGPAASEEKSGRDPQKHPIELIASLKPHSIQAESYRSIRTTLLVSAPPDRSKSLLITSPLAGEGKSTIVSNLGITLAMGRFKVVIVDSDLRRPKQHRIFGQDFGPGLTRYLSSDINPYEVLVPTRTPNLSFINSGPRPVNPIELLSSEKMGRLLGYLKEGFDYILLDTPPVLAVSDALAISSLADTVIVICRGDHTPVTALKQAKLKLDTHGIKCLGVILNDVNLVEQDGYYAREYYHYAQPQ